MEYRSIRGGQVVHPVFKNSVNEQNTKTLFFWPLIGGEPRRMRRRRKRSHFQLIKVSFYISLTEISFNASFQHFYFSMYIPNYSPVISLSYTIDIPA